MLLVALVLGFVGGLAGGALIGLLTDEDPPAASVDPGAPAPAPSAQSQVVANVLPAVVTVIAEVPGAPDEDGSVIVTRNIGSGVVIDQQGSIVTNAHVIAGATSVTVLSSDGSASSARLIGLDWPYTDLAVLIAPVGATPVPLGASAVLLPGDPVIAVGANGFTLEPAVRTGVVSATGVEWPRNGVIYRDLIQTDAAINNGDSGGALLSAAGELVGILTTVVREGPGGQAIE